MPMTVGLHLPSSKVRKPEQTNGPGTALAVLRQAKTEKVTKQVTSRLKYGG